MNPVGYCINRSCGNCVFISADKHLVGLDPNQGLGNRPAFRAIPRREKAPPRNLAECGTITSALIRIQADYYYESSCLQASLQNK